MKVLSWNVNFRPPGDQIAEIRCKGPDIVTLQEVKVKFARDWAKRLSDIGLGHHHLSGENAWKGKDVPDTWYQCLIASRWKVTPDDIGWRSEAPYPELLGRATVKVPDKGDIDVFTVHIPNWEGNGWKKIDTFHVLSAELRGAGDTPRILTGDFNEPESFLESGEIVTFGEGTYEAGGTCTQTWRDHHGVERPSIEWTNGVLSVLGGVSHHGLRDAYRDRHGFETPPPVTHYTINGNNPRYFDHTFVSRHFDVRECDYYHRWREKGLSDHSPMWARLRLRTDQSDSKQWLASALQTLWVRTLNWSACMWSAYMRLYRRFARSIMRAFARFRG